MHISVYSMSLYLTIFYVSMLAGLIPRLDAGYEDSVCETALRVHRNTVYEASNAEELKIACPVHFCNDITPTISWLKINTWFEQGYAKVNMSDRVTTEWTRINDAEGISFLIFKKVLSSDSGQYQCQSENDVSHAISISVVCGNKVKVHRNTVHNATAGQQLKVACPVRVCEYVPPPVTWFKLKSEDYIRVPMSDRVTTEWIRTNNYKGMSFLIFHNVLSSDSGQYQCRIKNSVSHSIKVYVNVIADPQTHLLAWSFLYFLAAVTVFFIIVTIVYIILKKRKEVQLPASSGETRNDSDLTNPALPHGGPGHDALNMQTVHIYDNDLRCVSTIQSIF